MKPAEWLVLDALNTTALNGGVRALQVAEIAGTEDGETYALLNQLVRRGLARQSRIDSGGRQISLWTITALGASTLNQACLCFHRRYDHVWPTRRRTACRQAGCECLAFTDGTTWSLLTSTARSWLTRA